jgi:hypothetical protein
MPVPFPSAEGEGRNVGKFCMSLDDVIITYNGHDNGAECKCIAND